MITRWGVALPEEQDLPALPRGVVLHWTAGGPRANDVDLEAYHYVVDADGVVKQGTHAVAENMRVIDKGPYAQHTGGYNSFHVGVAGAGMRGYSSRSSPGSSPLTAAQVRRMLELSCYFLRLGRLSPLNAAHLCTHLEVWTLHGIKGTRNDEKLDIEFLPFKPDLNRAQVGPFLRRTAAEIMEGGVPALPAIPQVKPSVIELAPTAPEPPHLDFIEHPRPDHLDRLAKMKGLAQDLLDATGKEALEVVETFGRRVIDGGQADLKEFIDSLADYLKGKL